MKKIVRFLAAFLITSVLFSGAAFAEINFDDYTVEELIALKTQITEVITERTSTKKSVRVPMGEYTIGVDIPAGTYTLTFNGDYAMISVYSESGEFLKSNLLSGESNTIGKIELQNGQQIKLSSGPIVFSPYKGLGF